MTRHPLSPNELCDVYIDESSQSQHRYLVLGGLVLATTDVAALINKLSVARLPELPAGEAKWTKVSRTKLPAYQRMVDVLFDHPDLAHFHALVVDTTKVDHHRFNQGSREIGFNKEIYQLAMKMARLYAKALFHLYPDHRETDQKTEDLRLMLNRGCAKKGDKRDWPFRRCQFRDSRKALPLQLTDILTGSLAYCLNGHGNALCPSAAKIALSAHILQRAKVSDVHSGTNMSGRFTIWHRRLR